jgi:hypothetical protein
VAEGSTPASLPTIPDLRPLSRRVINATSLPHSIFAKRLVCCADQLNPPPEAAIRALASSIIGGRGVFENARRPSSSHETQSRNRRAFYAGGRIPPDRNGSNRRIYMKTGSVGGGLVCRDSSIPGRHFAPDYKQHSPSIPNGNPSATRASALGRWQTSKQKDRKRSLSASSECET